MGIGINPQTGTTYTIAATDRVGYVTWSNASPIAVTLPQAGTTGFATNFAFVGCTIGAGTATITPTISTISYTNGSTYTSAAANLPLATGQCAWVYSDNTNYFAIVRTSGATGVTSVATTSPISGGTIITTGTISCPTCVFSAASLADNAIMVGVGSTQGSKTPSATTTLDSSGNMLGVTTIDKVTITQPATAATLTIANNKTLSATNTMDVAKTAGVAGGLVWADTTTSYSTTAAGAAKQVVLSGGTGTPTFLTFPDVKYSPAANCVNAIAGSAWSTGATPAALCRAGTNNKSGELSPWGASDVGYTQFHIDADTDLTTALPQLLLELTSTDAVNAHTIIMQESVACAKEDGTTTDDVAFNAARSFATITLNGNANRTWKTTLALNSTDMTGCTAPGLMWVKVSRTTDTATNVGVYGLALTQNRLLTAGAN
jgi:hypothetical protein